MLFCRTVKELFCWILNTELRKRFIKRYAPFASLSRYDKWGVALWKRFIKRYAPFASLSRYDKWGVALWEK